MEVSPVECLSRLYKLCFSVGFLNSVVTLKSVHAGLLYMGMPVHASSCTHCGCACLLALLRHHCALLSASGITVSTLFDIPMLLCHVEELEVQVVQNIRSVSQLCLFCVSNWTKGF